MADEVPAGSFTDRNLLFGVLALQADLLTPALFAEACSAWAGRKNTLLADLLVERGWLNPGDRADVEKLLQRKLAKHQGDAQAGLAEITTDPVRQSLAGVDDADVRQSLAGLTTPPQGHVLLSTTAYVPTGNDRYTLSRLHATGGIGRVWLARDASLGRDVALKELRPERAGQPALWARFLREAQVTGQLEHPSIVPVYEVGRRPDEQPFYTMRFVRGRTLAEAARAYHERRARGEAGPLELRELLTAFVGVCQAVAYAHSRGVLHRDVKPQNVVLGDFGEVMLLDWGLAKVTGESEDAAAADRGPVALAGEGKQDETVAGQVLGTPAYMAPEQAEGRLDLLDARTDVYGLGAVLYEVLCGQPPFGGPDTTAVLRRVVHEAPLPPRSVVPGTPRALEAVCLKALAKQPAHRYGKALKLAGEVQRWLADEPVTAYRDPLATRLTRWGRRHRTLAAALAVALVAALGGLGAVLLVQRRANADLAAKNVELADEQAKVQARYVLAEKAIKTFHTGVSEEALLTNDNLKALRTKLLKQAADFYAELEKLLSGQADERSRKALGAAYFQLADLTDKIGDKKEALAVHRQALVLRRELSAEPGADVEARLDVARSLQMVGDQLLTTGDKAGALAAYEEERDIAARLEAEAPSDAVRFALGLSYDKIFLVWYDQGKSEDAFAAKSKALAILRPLAEANPAVAEFQSKLAISYGNLGVIQIETGKSKEGSESYQRAIAILQKLVDAAPAVPEFQQRLAMFHMNLANAQQAGRPQEALEHYERARILQQKLLDDNPAVSSFQENLATSYLNVAGLRTDLGQAKEARESYQRALLMLKKLVDGNPTVLRFQLKLAFTYNNLGQDLAQQQQLPAALDAHNAALPILKKLADGNPTVPRFQLDLALTHTNLGRVLVRLEQLPGARDAYDAALPILKKLVDGHPTELRFKSELALTHNNLGRVLARLEQLPRALDAFDAGLAIRNKLVEAEPKNPLFTNHLGYSYGWRGAARLAAGQPAAAAADLRRAVELWSGNAANDAFTRFELSRALALLAGLGGKAKSAVTTAEAKGFADRSVAALADAIKASWRPAGLDDPKGPDFDALRHREDFRKLLAELAQKSSAPPPK
jgi:serine/threonine-protein kinase